MPYDWPDGEKELRQFLNNKRPYRIVQPSWREARIISRLIRTHNLHDPNMIERRPREIRSSLFWIAKRFSNIVGSVGLIDWSPDGVEIVSHFTCEKFRKEGIGKYLLEYAIKEAKKHNPRSILLFTTQVEYYTKLGFTVTDPIKYSRKINERCQNCQKGQNGPGFPPCPEIAMEYNGNF